MRSFIACSLIVSFLALLAGCSKNNPVSEEATLTGSVNATVYLEKVGSLGKARALGKTSAISLSKGYLLISADGENDLLDSMDLSGSSQQNMNKIFSDIKVKLWKAVAWTVDQNDSIIHKDSTTFTIVENDTVDVNLNLSAKYSMFEARIFPISDSAKNAEVLVNGELVVDSTFGKSSSLDTVKMFFDYLPASPSPGTSVTIKMNIRGDWIDADTLLWTGEKTFDVISGSDLNETIVLNWVGPEVGGADISVVIGKVGTVVVDGEIQPRPNSGP